MKDEYDIEKLNPRKNPYVPQKNVYESIMQGLNEAIKYEKGEKTSRVVVKGTPKK